MSVSDVEIEGAIEDLREILRLDGADIEVKGVAEGAAQLRLRLEDVSCLDCVMPRTTLEEMFLTHLQDQLQGIETVSIEDPRDHPDFDASGH